MPHFIPDCTATSAPPSQLFHNSHTSINQTRLALTTRIPKSTATMSEGDYRVADISLADFGRREIDIAEHEVSTILWTRAAHPTFYFLWGFFQPDVTNNTSISDM